ncbi:MAG: type III pantothenate kinase [Acidobacteria bacterium]|nr:type III pantothenate kinase [Acidobacteriota bacterium]
MLLAVDIGNTDIHFGIFDEKGLQVEWRLRTRPEQTADEYGLDCVNVLRHFGLNKDQLSRVLIASVVPVLDTTITAMCRKYIGHEPEFIDATRQQFLAIDYVPPTDVGADRVASAVAAYLRFGAPLIIIDFGTATTFDAVDRHGVYLGGAIVPGVLLSAETLSRHAARLPDAAVAKPSQVIGRNTVESVQSGLYYGSLLMVEGMVARFREQLGRDAKVVVTGALLDVFRDDLTGVTAYERDLTLTGLYYIHSKKS